MLYGGKDDKPVAKKMTSTKTAELGGSGAVKPVPMSEWKNASTKDTRAGALSAVHGGKGAVDAIAGYKDNDVTASLVNCKHANPTLSKVKDQPRAVKASSKVNWEQPKGRQLSLQ